MPLLDRGAIYIDKPAYFVGEKSEEDPVSSPFSAFLPYLCPMQLEQTLAEIRDIVAQLQKGSLDFDKQIALYQRGRELVQQCYAYLESAELDVKLLLENDSLQPFADPNS